MEKRLAQIALNAAKAIVPEDETGAIAMSNSGGGVKEPPVFTADPPIQEASLVENYENYPAQSSLYNTPHFRGFSNLGGRRAILVSVVITILVITLSVVSALFLAKNQKSENANNLVPLQEVNIGEPGADFNAPELTGKQEALIVKGDIITQSSLKVSSEGFIVTIKPGKLSSNQEVTLPNMSGELCLDSNNCNFASNAQLQALTNRLGQIVVPAVPNIPASSLVNNQVGSVSIQGVSNRVSVSTNNGIIRLSTPQDLASVSSPTFSNMVLNGNLNVGGSISLPLNCTTFLNGGSLTTNASGQIICADDETSSGGTSVTTPGGVSGNIPVFTGADTIDDSIISQALGTITVSGDLSASGALSANSLTLATDLSVVNGGTGSSTFTANGVLLGNGTGAISATAAPSNGQILLGNGTTPAFTTISGDISLSGAGVTTIQANSVALGVDSSGDYVANFTAGGGLTGNATGEGSTPTLAIVSANGGIVVGPDDIALSVQASKGLEVDSNGLSFIDCLNGEILKYNGSSQWACAPDSDTTGSFSLAGSSGVPQTISNGDTITIAAGNNITTTAGATDTVTVATVNNPNFTTSVTTPLLQSSGALSITPGGALSIGATGQTALLQGSTTTVASNGAGNDIVLTTADQIRLTGFNCTGFANGGVLSTDASGNLSCQDDAGDAATGITGTGSTNRLAIFTGAQTVGDSWLLQNGSTLQLDNTRNLELVGGNFIMGGDTFSDLTGTGLIVSSGSLQTTLGTSVDLTSEVNGILPAANGGTGINGTSAANGTLLIGNGTGYTLATLTDGTGITITEGAGSITVTSTLGTSISNSEIDNDAVTLGTQTTGNYVMRVQSGSGITGGSAGSEGSDLTLALGPLTADWNQSGAFDLLLNNASSELRILESSGATFYGSLDVGDLTANRTYTLPNSDGEVCLVEAGNCAGSGNGITGSGTQNRLAKFGAGGDNIADSTISDDGSTVTTTADLVVQGGQTTIGVASSQTGSVLFKHSGSAFTGTILQGALSGDQTYTLPNASGEFCLTSGNCVGGGGGGAPNGAAYLTIGNDGTLNAERSITAGTNLSATDGGANSTYTLNVVNNPTFSGLITANGGLNVEAGDTFTFNGDSFADLTGTGLQISGGALQAALGTSVDLTTEVTGILPIANGGTNAATAQAAINNLSGLTTNGDLLYHNGTNSIRLARGANGECLISNATTILWSSCSAGSLTALTLAGSSGTPQAIGNNDTITIAAGSNITTTAGATDTVTVATVNNPTFSTSVTTPLLTSTGALSVNATSADLTLQTTTTGNILLNSAGGTIELQDNVGVTGTLTVSGLVSANGGLTVEAGDTLTVNGDGFTDLTGTGLIVSSGSLQTTLGTSIDLTTEVTGVLPIANGGTNAATAQAAINNISGLTTNGDLLYHNGTNSSRLARGTNNQCLVSTATSIQWQACFGSGSGGTLQASYDAGNTITTTDARNIDITLANTATDANFEIDIATGSTGEFQVESNGTDVLQIGSSGQLQLDVQGSAGGILLGGDAFLYRSGANTINTQIFEATALRSIFGGSESYLDPGVLYLYQGSSQNILESALLNDTQNRLEINSDGRVFWGNGTAAPDTNLYRSAADTLRTDDRLQVATGLDLISSGTGSSNGIRFGASQDADIYRTAAGTLRFNGGSVQLDNGAGSGGITIGSTLGSSVNLYRSAADVLRTSDALTVDGILTGSSGASFSGGSITSVNQIQSDSYIVADNDGPNRVLIGFSTPGLVFGSLQDTNLYRSGADTLRTDDNFIAGNDLTVDTNTFYVDSTNNRVGIGTATPDPGVKLHIQDSSSNVVQYIQSTAAASTANTSEISLRVNSSTQARTAVGLVGSLSVTNDATRTGRLDIQLPNNGTFETQFAFQGNQMLFGSAGDTNLYRSAANTLATDDAFHLLSGGAGGRITIDTTNGLQEYWQNDANPHWRLSRDAGGSGLAGLLFGPGGATTPDTNLYRSAAGTLRTDTDLHVADDLIVFDQLRFSSSEDAMLYRRGADQLSLGDGDIFRAGNAAGDELFLQADAGAVYVNSINNAAGDWSLATKVSGDAHNRFILQTNGVIEWGSGAATRDTNLYRVAANTLRTDDELEIGTINTGGTVALCSNGSKIATCNSGASTSTLQSAYDLGNTITTTNARDIDFTLADTATDANFDIDIATGSTSQFRVQAAGSNLFTVSSTALQINAFTRIERASGSDIALQVRTAGDTQGRFRMDADGTIRWGDGTAAPDTDLFRNAANVLRTTDALMVDQLFTGSLGATISGATTSINNNSNFATNINTGTSTGAVSIGNSAAGTISLQSAGAINMTVGANSTFATTGAQSFIFKSGTNNTSAFQVQNSSNVSILSVDTSNSNVTIAAPSGTGATLILDTTAGGSGRKMYLDVGATGTSMRIVDDIDGAVFSANGDNGNVTMGQSHTAANLRVDIGGARTSHAVCHSGGNTDNDNVDIVDCNGTPSGDYQEMYPTKSDVAPADIVTLSDDYSYTNTRSDRVSKLTRTTNSYQQPIGVIANPDDMGDFNTIGNNINESDRPMPLGLKGRVTTKISDENGSIQPGDLIAASSTPGVGMKATGPGWVVGTALEAYDGTGQGSVLIFLNTFYYNPSVGESLQSEKNSNFSTLNVSGNTKLNNLTVSGSAVFKGNITINGHIITAGETPTYDVLIGGITVSISGNDTAGSIVITTGGTQITQEELAKVIFSQSYGAAPRIILSAQNKQSAEADIYPSNKQANKFTLASSTPLKANTTYKLDYFIVE
jgi:hypothetical protein